MRDGALPAALIVAALALALSFAPPRVRIPAFLAMAIAALAMMIFEFPREQANLVYLVGWAVVVLTAACVHWRGGLPVRYALVLALLCGVVAGSVASLADGVRDLAAASPALLLFLPARWLVARGWGISVKVISSWLIVIAVLAAALSLTPTPGYAPDHMD